MPCRLLPAVWLLALALLVAACSPAQLHHQEGYVFGTRIDLTLYDAGALEAAQIERAFNAVLQEFDRIHRAWHAWQPSELTRLNAALAAGKTLEVSPELAARLHDAQHLAQLGDGLFDPGIGRLIALWGFQGDEFPARLPDPQALAAALAQRASIAQLHIDGNQISSPNRALQIDLGGYAKGYALDQAARILRHNGIDNALINIGGNLLALGQKGDLPWRIGIQHPRSGAPLATLPLYNGEAIGTSGDYQRFFELDGRRYSHLIDPRSGKPAQDTQSLTVLILPQKNAGTLSDAASKPAFIAGANWRQALRPWHIRHALRVDAAGDIEVTRPLHRRLQFPAQMTAKITVVD